MFTRESRVTQYAARPLEGVPLLRICYYLCTYVPQGFLYVTDLKVLPAGDRAPLGFMPLTSTMDDS